MNPRHSYSQYCGVLFRPGFNIRTGPIPREVRDQIFFMAFEYRQQGRCLGHFMVHAWTRFRIRHQRILTLLCDFDLVYAFDRNGHQSYEWKSDKPGPAPSDARPQRSEDGRSAGLSRAFFDARQGSDFFGVRVVAPRMSPIFGNHHISEGQENAS